MSQPEFLGLPEYTRFPKREAGAREPYTNLAWSTLDRLVRPQKCNDFQPPVKSKLLSARGIRGSGRGARLIHLKSLLDYLGRQPEEFFRPKPQNVKEGAK